MVATNTRPANPAEVAPAYGRLEERILARDQIGATEAFHGLLRDNRPAPEIIGELVRIHAPYTHVPYHERMDDGVPRFVNNDHCLLSARASLRLMDLLSPELRSLPLAQTVWYIPTGLDPWNQLIGKAPGHYTRLYNIEANASPPPPQVHWPDQEPLHGEGTFKERLNSWLTLVQRGEVLASYRLFLGLLEDEANRSRLLSQLMFAGLIDVQDRMLFNRSYTTGHKSFRARATVELGEALGWERARSVVYAGVPDIAVGPRWYSTYEMACAVTQNAFEGRDHDLLHQSGTLDERETEELVDGLLYSQEPVWIHQISGLLKAGKGPRQILDVVQVVSAELILRTVGANDYSMSQHSFEYCNTLRWYLDHFDHPHQVKLLYIAAAFVNRASHHIAITTGHGQVSERAPNGSEALSQRQLLRRIDEAILALNTDESVALTALYLRNSYERAPLVQALALTAAKFGNDPHNQELGLCLIEDYLHSTAADRDRLLLAAAKHTAGHRKYGDPLEAYRRYAEAFAIDTRERSRGDGPIEEAVLDEG